MNKRQVIQHAKDYLDLLAAGTDPISNEKIEGDSVVSRPQMQKCFQFVSTILQEVLQNNGLFCWIWRRRPARLPLPFPLL